MCVIRVWEWNGVVANFMSSQQCLSGPKGCCVGVGGYEYVYICIIVLVWFEGGFTLCSHSPQILFLDRASDPRCFYFSGVCVKTGFIALSGGEQGAG